MAAGSSIAARSSCTTAGWPMTRAHTPSPDRYLVLDATQTPDELAAAIRVRVADLLSGLPLQTLPQADAETTQPAPPVQHHPHAQTGSTPQLHP